MSLKCEVCALSSNHCCKADILMSKKEALFILDNLPNHIDRKDMMIIKDIRRTNAKMLIHKSYNNKDISVHPCIFLVNGKCSIYDIKPYVCKMYGTKYMKCMMDFLPDVNTLEEFNALTKQRRDKADKESFLASELNHDILEYINRIENE